METNEVQTTGQPAPAAVSRNASTPGTGERVSTPAASAAPVNRGGRPRGSGRPLSQTPGAIKKRKYAAIAAAKKAGTANGQTAKTNGTKTGQGGNTTAGKANEGKAGPETLVVDPLDVRLGATAAAPGEIPDLDLTPLIGQFVKMLTDVVALNRPVLDEDVIASIPELAPYGGTILQQNWTFSPEQCFALAGPIAGIIPNLPARAQKQIEKYMPYFAVAGAVYMAIVPRINNERRIIAAIREFNAGTAPAQPGQQSAQNQSGANTSQTARNGAEPNVNVTGLPQNPLFGQG